MRLDVLWSLRTPRTGLRGAECGLWASQGAVSTYAPECGGSGRRAGLQSERPSERTGSCGRLGHAVPPEGPRLLSTAAASLGHRHGSPAPRFPWALHSRTRTWPSQLPGCTFRGLVRGAPPRAWQSAVGQTPLPRPGDRPRRGGQASSCRTSKEQDGDARASQVTAGTGVSRGMGDRPRGCWEGRASEGRLLSQPQQLSAGPQELGLRPLSLWPPRGHHGGP